MQPLWIGLLLGWFSLLYIGIPGLCGKVRRHHPDAWMYHSVAGLLLALFVGAVLHVRFTDWVLLPLVLVHAFMQYRAHWHHTLFGAPPAEVASYNEVWRDRVRILPRSQTRIVPDAYHTILHVLLVANLVALLARHLPG